LGTKLLLRVLEKYFGFVHIFLRAEWKLKHLTVVQSEDDVTRVGPPSPSPSPSPSPTRLHPIGQEEDGDGVRVRVLTRLGIYYLTTLEGGSGGDSRDTTVVDGS
jgi:hypothetical protein